jgi:5-methylcytosine-specific restriction endonuclease McrA
MKYFGYDESDFIPCEFCGKKAVDIHHLEPRSIAKAKVNLIDNLMTLCRGCHDAAGKSVEFNNHLKVVHRKKLLSNGLPDNETKRYL